MDIQNTEKIIYLDNAATTCTDPEAAQAALEMMCTLYANPSSAHGFGFEAEKRLRAAREQILTALGVSSNSGSLIFTSSGTESDNLAIRGAAQALCRRGKHIVLSDSEHPAVKNTALALEKEGFMVSYIPTKGGKLDLEAAKQMLTSDTVVVSCMAVNNETGAIYDLKSLIKIVRQNCPNAIFHTDAVQAFTKCRTTVLREADLVSISSHKIYAPKGAGALYVRKGIRLLPQTFGGGQENGMRSGTEALPAICAFGTAAQRAASEFDSRYEKVSSLNCYLREKLADLPQVKFNTPFDGFSPYVLSLAVPGIRSEIFLRFLSERGIYVSAGSACSSKHADNQVLSAFGLTDDQADSTLRVSFSYHNTPEQLDKFVESLNEGIHSLITVKSAKHN